MALVKDMAAVATECVSKPGRVSIWSEQLGNYVCVRDPRFEQAIAEQLRNVRHPPISSAFKLVFLTAAGGTLLFVVICVASTIFAGKDMPAPLDKLIQGLFDLAKIGFGAVVGLLGAQSLGRNADFELKH